MNNELELLQVDLLSQPYRDRQLIVLAEDLEHVVEHVEIKLGDYIALTPQAMVKNAKKGLNLKSRLKKDYWLDTKNWGVTGYAIDQIKNRVRGAGNSSDLQSMRYLKKVRSDIAEKTLTFPPGHPLYDTVYAGHPLKPAVYVPLANFHRVLFEEKFNELLTLLRCLGAARVTIDYVTGYRDRFEGGLSASVPLQLPVQAGGSIGREVSRNAEATLEAIFDPVGDPYIPDSMAWFEYEPTWKNIADARINARLKVVDVELRYDDHFNIDADIAAKLNGLGFKLGGEFEKHEQTLWRFHSTFN